MGPLLSARRTRHSSSGITLIEVLVTIGIVGVLLSFLLPAIYSSRRSAQKVQCTSNLRQIGQAIAAFESSTGGLPKFYFHRDLLPFIDQRPLWEAMNLGRRFTRDELIHFSSISIPLYECPVDPAPEVFEVATFQYADEEAWCLSAAGTNYVSNYNWYRPRVEHPFRFSELINGQSQSVLVSETLRADTGMLRMRTVWLIPGDFPVESQFHSACESLPKDPASFGYLTGGYRGAPWHGSGRSGIATYYDHQLPPNRPNCESLQSGFHVYPAISMHVGGVHALYADGHVSLVNESVDASLWREAGRLSRHSVLE